MAAAAVSSAVDRKLEPTPAAVILIYSFVVFSVLFAALRFSGLVDLRMYSLQQSLVRADAAPGGDCPQLLQNHRRAVDHASAVSEQGLILLSCLTVVSGARMVGL